MSCFYLVTAGFNFSNFYLGSIDRKKVHLKVDASFTKKFASSPNVPDGFNRVFRLEPYSVRSGNIV